MKKVIVKCKLKDRDQFEQKLTEIDMDFAPMYWQHDRVYIPRNYQKRSSYPRLILRTEMRAVDRPPRYQLILRRHIEDSGIDIVDATPITDYSEAANIILQLGFQQQAEVSLRRQELVLGDHTRMFLDKIDGLAGYFAKIEAELADGDKVEDVRADLIHTFSVLGQPASSIIEDTYSDSSSPKL